MNRMKCVVKRLLFVACLFIFIGCWFDLQALYSGNRVSSYPYISGDTFRAACDFIFDDDSSFEPAEITKPSIVFVQPEFLENFFANKHPLIQAPYVLVTHNSDESVPGQFVHYLEDPKLIHWFGQNPSIDYHQKFTPIPIGLANRFWPNGKTELVDRARECIGNHERTIQLYVNFSRFDGQPWDEASVMYKQERAESSDVASQMSFAYRAPRKGQLAYLEDLTRSRFVLSPRGHGLDCHRTWEALLMGAISIVKTSPLDSIYQKLPVVIVHDWREVTEDFLNKKYVELSAQQFDKQKLYARYWIDKIRMMVR